ncbi:MULTISPECIES: hypothetical protein [unclassified Streptomyces]|uniref:hypothetical protein n=1 Tax=unclassified Streptomyces TaxID=2593676 RepID=UPI0035E3A744
MSTALYRYAVFLAEETWKSAVRGWEKRVQRFRAPEKRAQVERIWSALSEAEGDAFPDGDETKYVLYLTEADYAAFQEGATHPKYGAPHTDAQRIASELLSAAGDSRPL